MPIHPLKTALRHFLTIYQERKVFGMFWIYPLTIDKTKNTANGIYY